NRMLTSSFAGWNNYMTDLGKVIADAEAMKHFGNTMVVWDFHARTPIQTLQVPGAPLEIRWALQPRHNYAFTATPLTSKIWLIEQQEDGTFRASAVGDVADPRKTPFPVDISLSADDRSLRRHLHGRLLPRLRGERPAPPEAGAHPEDRLPGEHGV